MMFIIFVTADLYPATKALNDLELGPGSYRPALCMGNRPVARTKGGLDFLITFS
jgi:hypothetical protein